MKSRLKKEKGFTLLEMIISVGVFTVIMTIIVGALLVVSDTFHKTRSLRTAMENVSLAMEGMIKKIRTGTNYDCNAATPARDNCSGGLVPGNAFQFTGSDGKLFRYRWNSSEESIEVSTFPLGGSWSTYYPVTAPEIKITNFKIYLYGTGNNQIQDYIIMTITGYTDVPGKPQSETEFSLQTVVSKRVLDVFSP
jgi:prepilin-type N-terminal cleavage/methylation domain-containing protein